MSVAELPVKTPRFIPAAVPPDATVTPSPPPDPIYDPYADAPSDVLFEVVDGVRVEKVVGVYEHAVAGVLHGRLDQFCREHRPGRAYIETMFAIPGSGNDRKPDVVFLSYQTWPQSRGVPRSNAWAVAPDLVVEVVSPTDKAFDMLDKLAEYFAGGVKAVWLIFSRVGQVYCYTSPAAVRILTRADDLTGDPVVPGFRLPVAELFPEPEADPAPAAP